MKMRSGLMVSAVFILVSIFTGTSFGQLVDNGDGTVTDTATGLMWQQATAPGAYTWTQALSYCEGLDFAGHTDWRLPTRKELRSIVDHGRYGPSIDMAYFPDTVASYYWSSTTYAYATAVAWVVSFHRGYADGHSKSNYGYVRAVRGGQSDIRPFGYLVWPLSGSFASRRISKPFGADWPFRECPEGVTKRHTGIDVNADQGEPVRAAAAGSVKAVVDGTADGWAKAVTIEHMIGGAAYTTVYWHLDPSVTQGQWLAAGSVIGTIADLGDNTHFHFGIRKGSYSNTSNAGALPREDCGGYPAYPENFIDPASLSYNQGGDSATFGGKVVAKDNQGNILGPLAGAVVQSGGKATTTDGSGGFVLEGLSSGIIAVSVSKEGYYPTTGQYTVTDGDNSHKTIYLTSLSAQSADAPMAGEISSPQGNHFIAGMPGDLEFETTVAWNGSPGSVRFRIAGEWYVPVLTDSGSGSAKAELTIRAPMVSSCSEMTMEVTNGEGKVTYINTGVHFSPVFGILPWYEDNIIWTHDKLSLFYSEDFSKKWDLPISSDVIGFKAGLGYKCKVKYDMLSASFSGSLNGKGTFDFSIPTPQPEVKILGGADLGIEGALSISMAGCDPPVGTPSWSMSFSGKAGAEAPVVLFLDAIAPPVGSTLANIPVIKDIKLQLFQKVGGKLTGKYKNLETGECFLGSSSFSGSVSGGHEGTALVEFKKLKTKAGVYVGGTGTYDIGICPDFAFNGYTGRLYAGAFASSFGFEKKIETGAEICWDFTGSDRGAQALSLPGSPVAVVETSWEPVGRKPLQWGEVNRIPQRRVIPMESAVDDLTTGGSTDEQLIVENVIDLANPTLVANSARSTVLFTLHDTEKPWYAATDIGRLLKDGAAPWAMNRVTDDLDAEFDPRMVALDTQDLLTVWTRVEGDVSAAQSPEEIAPHLEIVASFYNRAEDSWSAPLQLTANDGVDRSPLPVVFGENRGVLWIQNQGPAMIGGTEQQDRLMYMGWDGSNWSAPVVLWADMKGFLEFSFAADAQGEAGVVFSLDEDGNPETDQDRELYQIQTAGGIWQTAERITADETEDALPVLVSLADDLMVVWKAGSNLKYAFLNTWNPKDVYFQDTQFGEAPSLDGIEMPGGAIIAYSAQNKDGIDIVASFYDAGLDKWSLPRQMTFDEHAETSLSMDFDGQQLVIAYLKTQTNRENKEIEINGQTQVIEDVPQPGRTDLYVLRHTIGNDVAVAAESITFDPANLAPGSKVEITAIVANNGDLPLQDISLAFYDGDPEGNGTLIEQTTIFGTLVAGADAEVAVSWDVPAEQVGHEVFVVVDPDLAIEDRDRSNNTVKVSACKPDIAIAHALSNATGPSTRMITVSVTNQGTVPAANIPIVITRAEASDVILHQATIDTLAVDATYDVAFEWDTADEITTHGYILLNASANQDQAIEEVDYDNNTRLLQVSGAFPGIPANPSIVSGTMDVSMTPTLDWDDVPTATSYRVFIWKGSESRPVEPVADGLPESRFTFSQRLDPSTEYRWQVVAVNESGESVGEEWSFTTESILTGDIDNSGAIDLDDAILAFRIAIGLPIEQAVYPAADVNGDGAIGLAEALYVLQRVAGVR